LQFSKNNPSRPSSSALAGKWLDLESLAFGNERVGGMVVQSSEMRAVLKAIARLSAYKATVLVLGESGTGKELVARALHTLGPTANGPFVTFDCSNLIESLAESQLFGHVRGAFTDAREDSMGYFRSANNGTLFLDEIGELPLRLQPKLLRAVELHEVQPVGSVRSHRVNIRLVAATNRDLSSMVKAGLFRDDLYYRLTATAILIPPLRQRRDDIQALAAHFIAQYSVSFGKDIRLISSHAMAALTAYDWPGNVRELSNTIQSAVLQTDGDRIDAAALPTRVTQNTVNVDMTALDKAFTDQPSEDPVPAKGREQESLLLLDDVIKKTLIRSLKETEGNRQQAASLLGISRSTLYRMIQRYQIPSQLTGRKLKPRTAGFE
jgi:DNA-binding NtrC family response regulator